MYEAVAPLIKEVAQYFIFTITSPEILEEILTDCVVVSTVFSSAQKGG